MICPIDQTTLTIADRQGIEIDFCPTCRGVWLDRGELDKLIERSGNFGSTRQPEYRDEHHNNQGHYDSSSKDSGDYHKKHHKKESFLGDFFDF